MRVKICGVTKPEQGRAIAHCRFWPHNVERTGAREKRSTIRATALGFICVPSSPRYVSPEQILAVQEQLPSDIDRIGVFANTTVEAICEVAIKAKLNGVQLHSDESPDFCDRLRQLLPDIELIKALRIKTDSDLEKANNYLDFVDTLLLDAYHPNKLGGTGKTLKWNILKEFRPRRPWLLAGGLNPDNVVEAIAQIMSFSDVNIDNNFSGIDLSSGVEIAPGDKDLAKVALLFERLASFSW